MTVPQVRAAAALTWEERNTKDVGTRDASSKNGSSKNVQQKCQQQKCRSKMPLSKSCHPERSEGPPTLATKAPPRGILTAPQTHSSCCHSDQREESALLDPPGQTPRRSNAFQKTNTYPPAKNLPALSAFPVHPLWKFPQPCRTKNFHTLEPHRKPLPRATFAHSLCTSLIAPLP